MANQRLPMHLLRQILLLQQQKKSIRDIARSLGLARNTVRGYLRMLPDPATLSLPQLSDQQLDELVQSRPPAPSPGAPLPILQQRFAQIDRELTRPGVTRYSLWLDYKTEHPDGYQYTQFCHYYQLWSQRQQTSMHMEHKAGDKLFVDFAGKRLLAGRPDYRGDQAGRVLCGCTGLQSAYLRPGGGYSAQGGLHHRPAKRPALLRGRTSGHRAR